MPIDDLYKKLNEPAPDAFPKFEEESWRKMEVLLDKHLPENNGKLFPFILLLSCVILASLTTFLPAKRTAEKVEGKVAGTNRLTSTSIPVIGKSEVAPVPVVDDDKIDLPTKLEISQEKLAATNVVQIKPNRQDVFIIKTEKEAPQQNEFVNNTIPDARSEVSLTATGKASLLTNKNNFQLLKNEPAMNRLLVVANKKSATLRKPVKNNFSLTFSTGLEAPGTAFNTWGRLTPLVGVGVQYSFRNRIVLRTGIATATKIYSAGDKDYNPPGYWYSYVTFNKIDAECKITEIPLSVAYRVAGGRQTSLFVSAGASSYIMRKEAYEYYYKNQYGNDTVVNRSFNNNSFHLFSGVNFSVIAERKITDRFSLMAEPIIKIPTAGIGYGKVRLYNAGVTVSARFQLR